MELSLRGSCTFGGTEDAAFSLIRVCWLPAGCEGQYDGIEGLEGFDEGLEGFDERFEELDEGFETLNEGLE